MLWKHDLKIEIEIKIKIEIGIEELSFANDIFFLSKMTPRL